MTSHGYQANKMTVDVMTHLQRENYLQSVDLLLCTLSTEQYSTYNLLIKVLHKKNTSFFLINKRAFFNCFKYNKTICRLFALEFRYI